MIAFIFPGQGSQKLNMISHFYAETVIKDTFEEAADAVGFDVLSVITTDETRLNQTEITQPAILATSIALYRLFQSRYPGQRPDRLAGHSLGEYSALVVAEVLSFQDALRLVATRGRLMQAAVPEGTGGMAAILGLTDEGVIAACKKAAEGEIVSAVNFNSPGQVVIAGQKEAVARAVEACKIEGAKRALPLPVSVPSHCALMIDAAGLLGQHFESISWHMPKIPIVHNVDAAKHETVPEIKAALTAQLYQPVRWVDCIHALAEAGNTAFVECGPGKVLTGLNKRILDDVVSLSLEDEAGFDAFKALCQ